jgi:hypothetical protein
MSKRVNVVARASLALAIVMGIGSAARATPFLMVDIEGSSGSTTQAGFTSWQVAAGGASNFAAVSKTFSGIG